MRGLESLYKQIEKLKLEGGRGYALLETVKASQSPTTHLVELATVLSASSGVGDTVNKAQETLIKSYVFQQHSVSRTTSYLLLEIEF